MSYMSKLALKTVGPAQARKTALGHGIAMGSTVLTLDGALPVEFLSPGDRILTRAGARRLRSIEVTVIQNDRVIRVTQDSLGNDRPCEDMIVVPEQPLLIRDWRANAMCGAAQAMIAAERLADGEFIRAEIIAEVRIFTLRFQAEEVIYAGGLELACAPELVEV